MRRIGENAIPESDTIPFRNARATPPRLHRRSPERARWPTCCSRRLFLIVLFFRYGDADKRFVRIPVSSVIAANEFGSTTALTAAKR